MTIGQTNRGYKSGYPIIGDRVWIGANAVIVGNIKISNVSLIAPLSYVTKDVPDNAVVAGNPASLVKDQGSKEYIKFLHPNCGTLRNEGINSKADFFGKN